MPTKYPIFDRSQLKLLPLDQRRHDLSSADILELDQSPMPYQHADLPALAAAIRDARKRGAAVALLIGRRAQAGLVAIHRGLAGAKPRDRSCRQRRLRDPRL